MIYNGPSIYNFGGGAGGGGYSDGGELVDGDFIKVENNTISSYDNVSRDPVNFYIELTDGEISNAVVELTTAVNATIKVYIAKNDLIIPLGNVGGDTVNAGDNYKINITGDSFIIEVVTPGGGVPEYVKINGDIYKVIENNGCLWTCSDLLESSFDHVKINDVCYYKKNKDLNINGWHLPNSTQLGNLNNSFTWQQLRSTSGWDSGYGGNNDSGFNAIANGYYNYSGHNVAFKGSTYWMQVVDNDNECKGCIMDSYSKIVIGGNDINEYTPIRLVKEL